VLAIIAAIVLYALAHAFTSGYPATDEDAGKTM
jgi:hypothetical protein